MNFKYSGGWGWINFYTGSVSEALNQDADGFLNSPVLTQMPHSRLVFI